MKSVIPHQIETERLILRRFQDSDWRDLAQYYGDAECMKFTNGKAMSNGLAWRSMASMVGHWELRGYGPYAMVEKSSSTVLGPVGLWFPVEWPEPEIKWGLARHAWGSGFATEAATAVRDMAASYLPQYHLASVIHVDNAGSIGVATRMGARLEREIKIKGMPCGLYRHVAPRLHERKQEIEA